MSAPRSYQNFAEFQREEIRSDQKCGWSIDDLWKDAELRGPEVYDDGEAEDLDFGR